MFLTIIKKVFAGFSGKRRLEATINIFICLSSNYKLCDPTLQIGVSKVILKLGGCQLKTGS